MVPDSDGKVAVERFHGQSDWVFRGADRGAMSRRYWMQALWWPLVQSGGQQILGCTGPGSYAVARDCALGSQVLLSFTPTVGVSSLPQQNTVFIIVHCRGIEELGRRWRRIRAAFVVQGGGGVSRAEIFVGSGINKRALSLVHSIVPSVCIESLRVN